MVNLQPCKNCGKIKDHHSKGMCFNCYRKLLWKPKPIVCKHCKKERPHQAFGLCRSCHPKLTRYEKIKEFNYVKYHNIPLELYKEITKACMVCGFDKIINLHHLDHNRKNNTKNNLIGLCPNHHKMIHDYRFSQEIVGILMKKGIEAKLTKF